MACPERLLDGDTVTLSIGDAGWPPAYQVGDTITMPVLGEQPFALAGGQTGTDGQTWYVTGSVDGPLPTFAYDPNDSPSLYSGGGLSFGLYPGGIPFAKGDRFAFGVTGGQFRWRKDGGAWSGPQNIPVSAVALDAGLSATFIPGAVPSFAIGDTFTFRALQPWAVSNVQSPTPAMWRWNTATPNLVADLGADTDLEVLAIAAHTLPDGCTITVEGGTLPGVYDWSEAVTWREGVMVHALSVTRTSRYVRVSMTGATGGGIGFLWIGVPLSTTLSAAVQPRRSYKMSRASTGLYRGAKYLGFAMGADVEWTEAALSDADVEGLTAMLDHVKQNGDEPLVFVPQITRPAEAYLVQLVQDQVEFAEVMNWNANVDVPRRFSVRLPLEGVAR